MSGIYFLYDLSTMKAVKYIKTEAEYEGYSGHSTDLYFTDDSRYLNYYFSAPPSGISNFFNRSYGIGTRQYSVPDLKLSAK
jgi:hypothetical protein